MAKKQYQTPKLIPLDMSLCTRDKEKRGHPDINSKDTYLCLIDGRYFSGKFSPVWYGWSFDGWTGNASLQFDPPNTNASRWQQIWKMVAPKVRRVRIPEDKCEVQGCKGRLKIIDTKVGDPEGIRSDRQCRKCGQIYGCSKSSLFMIDKNSYEAEL